ncbi:MAG: hypothetical protein KY476_19120, partial [Planctomycetes bacterium]|nr:hypothetical protein [Planctomycetota bacterium]
RVKPARGLRSPQVQSRSADREPAAGKTDVTVELLYGTDGGALHAQEWFRAFEKLGYSVRLRRAVGVEKPELSESTVGTLRRVKLVGRLERSGELVFPERRFSRAESIKLGEWLEELKSYGAQGAPEGQPVWGLSPVQFDALYTSLQEETQAKTDGRTLAEALAALDLPKDYPLRLSSDSEAFLKNDVSDGRKVRQSVEGFAKGTALALMLNEFGLGFRPQRKADGSLELLIEPLKKTADVWPVGWEPKHSLPQTAPGLFELLPVELDGLKLTDVLSAVEAKTDVAIRIDHYAIETWKIDLENITVSYPPRKTSWSLLLRGVTNPHKLTREIKIDERGRPFVWITTLKIGRFGRVGPENDSAGGRR